MTLCALCGNSCIPMADYDLPVCAPCDLDFERGGLLRVWEALSLPWRPTLAPLDPDTDRDLRRLVQLLAEMMAGAA